MTQQSAAAAVELKLLQRNLSVHRLLSSLRTVAANNGGVPFDYSEFRAALRNRGLPYAAGDAEWEQLLRTLDPGGMCTVTVEAFADLLLSITGPGCTAPEPAQLRQHREHTANAAAATVAL